LSCFVTATSSQLGSRFPDGWLCATITLRALTRSQNR
jgi:hypothetical protein